MDFKQEVATRYPHMVAKAKSSRLVAVRLFCVECMGGSRSDAKACATTGCFLHPHRGSSWAQARATPAHVPPSNVPPGHTTQGGVRKPGG